MHVHEKVLCVSKDGSRIGYKKTRQQKIINYDHIFTLLRPTSEPRHLSDTNECSICCNALDGGVYTTKCGHKFHLECIVPWYSKHITCPLCRGSDIEYPLSVDMKQTP